jgi:6-phosphofructokinase
MKENLLIAMSGGTTSVINATLVGIITAAREVGSVNRVFAGYPGIKGALEESLVDLTDLADDDLENLYYTPASGFIGTTRIRLMEQRELARLAQIFSAHNIGFFINIGGNGTIHQSIQISRALSSQIKVAAVPKTVDNDLGDEEFERVLYTPGFPSCANYWRRKVWIMNQENLGAHSHDKVLIAQTFGRKTGFLAGCARLGDVERQVPLVILLPEDQRPLQEVMDHIETMVRKHDRAIVVLSEGYDVGDIGERYDLRGQVMYGTSNTTAAQLLVNHCADIGIQARSFVPGFDQRSDITFVSNLDLEMACGVGRQAVERLHAGQTDFLSSISKDSTESGIGEFDAVPFSEIGDYSRTLPPRWIDYDNFDVTDEYVAYVEPLIADVPVLIPGFPTRHYFVFQKGPTTYKKLKLWRATPFCEKDTNWDSELAAVLGSSTNTVG